MTDFNMPPGCSSSDLPGNTPEDEAWDRLSMTCWKAGGYQAIIEMGKRMGL